MSRILIFDTECNQLDTASGFIQELGWAIYDVNSWRLLKARVSLLKWNMHYEIDPGALAVTNLTRDYCEGFGEDAQHVITSFLVDALDCEYICGHNVLGYDKPMMLTNVARSCFSDPLKTEFNFKTVVDTLLDCPFPPSMKIHGLKYLALDHGYILSDAHTALADVFACKAILSKYDFSHVLAIASTPMVTLTSKIDFNDIESRDRIKNARFYWSPTRKLWEKRIREYYLPGIQLELGSNITLEKESK